jgi:hypothetical protein
LQADRCNSRNIPASPSGWTLSDNEVTVINKLNSGSVIQAEPREVGQSEPFRQSGSQSVRQSVSQNLLVSQAVRHSVTQSVRQSVNQNLLVSQPVRTIQSVSQLGSQSIRTF